MEYDEDDDFIEDEIRSAEEIAKRALVLGSLIATVYGASLPDTISWLKSENLWEELSPDELDYIQNPTDKKVQVNLSWRSEALVALLWSINKVSSLPPLTTKCDIDLLKNALVYPSNSTKNFISSAKLRDEDEISSVYEEVYDSHWSVRDARIHGKPIPNNFDAGVVYERHYGFNYVTGYCGLPWNEITCDT